MDSRERAALLIVVALFTSPSLLDAQGGSGGPRSDSLRDASRFDTQGRHAEARAIFQRLIDTAPDPAAKAAAQRRMAMSYGFEGHCANAVKYEEMVIAYWVTREQAEPRNAWYQQGEMANEAARVCIDASDVDTAERLYRRGSEIGLKEQERFFPYLSGYVALYTDDLPAAEVELTKALAIRANQNDPFMHCLLAMTYE